MVRLRARPAGRRINGHLAPQGASRIAKGSKYCGWCKTGGGCARTDLPARSPAAIQRGRSGWTLGHDFVVAVRVGFGLRGPVEESEVIDSTSSQNAQTARRAHLITIRLRSEQDDPTRPAADVHKSGERGVIENPGHRVVHLAPEFGERSLTLAAAPARSPLRNDTPEEMEKKWLTLRDGSTVGKVLAWFSLAEAAVERERSAPTGRCAASVTAVGDEE